jgi:hypothetical protein
MNSIGQANFGYVIGLAAQEVLYEDPIYTLQFTRAEKDSSKWTETAHSELL